MRPLITPHHTTPTPAIQIIPDLEELEDMENMVNVAAAPALKVNRLKTLFDTNVDADMSQGEVGGERNAAGALPGGML
jgi:hypothetical protein